MPRRMQGMTRWKRVLPFRLDPLKVLCHHHPMKPAILGILLAAATLTIAKEPVDISSELAALIVDEKVPALAAVAISKSEIVATGVAGIRKFGSPEKATLNDKFHIGSCTKSMTATLVAIIVADGKITWDTKAAEVFQDIKIHPGFREVTLRQLLSNTAGVPADIPDELWERFRPKVEEAEQRKILVTGILGEKPTYQPGKGNVYSNGGFSIAGAMLERVTGQPYETLMRERLFKPLGIHTAGFGAAATDGKVDHPYGHVEEDGKLVAVNSDNPAAISPAGRVHLSIKDFAKYANFHLGNLTNGPLDKEQLQDLHRVIAPAGEYASGWIVAKRDWSKGDVLFHNGSNTMNFAVTWLASAENFAVVIACNSGEGEETCDEAAALLIERFLAK
jgi:CubicO group peptidase (beta-lactamase class C family)